MLRWIAASLALFGTSLSAAPCPELKPGQSYPWQTSDEPMADDEWAYLFIDLDKKGRPKKCRVGKHKFAPETGFWMCRAMMGQGSFEPVLKDGVAVEGTVTRYMILRGRTWRRVEAAARKKYFKDHPEERPICYPS